MNKPRGIYVRTEEIRNKMSKALKGRESPMHGKHHSQETKDKLSKAQKGKSLSLETRCKQSKALQKFWLSDKSNECRDKMSKSAKMYWASLSDDKRRERMLKFAPFINGGKSTSIEEKVKEQLFKYGIKFIQQKCLCGGRFYIDFWLPSYQLVIECNGDYWHSRSERVERDQRLEEYVLSQGKDILWLWEYEIKDKWFDVADYLEIDEVECK